MYNATTTYLIRDAILSSFFQSRNSLRIQPRHRKMKWKQRPRSAPRTQLNAAKNEWFIKFSKRNQKGRQNGLRRLWEGEDGEEGCVDEEGCPAIACWLAGYMANLEQFSRRPTQTTGTPFRAGGRAGGDTNVPSMVHLLVKNMLPVIM